MSPALNHGGGRYSLAARPAGAAGGSGAPAQVGETGRLRVRPFCELRSKQVVRTGDRGLPPRRFSRSDCMRSAGWRHRARRPGTPVAADHLRRQCRSSGIASLHAEPESSVSTNVRVPRGALAALLQKHVGGNAGKGEREGQSAELHGISVLAIGRDAAASASRAKWPPRAPGMPAGGATAHTGGDHGLADAHQLDVINVRPLGPALQDAGETSLIKTDRISCSISFFREGRTSGTPRRRRSTSLPGGDVEVLMPSATAGLGPGQVVVLPAWQRQG